MSNNNERRPLLSGTGFGGMSASINTDNISDDGSFVSTGSSSEPSSPFRTSNYSSSYRGTLHDDAQAEMALGISSGGAGVLTRPDKDNEEIERYTKYAKPLRDVTEKTPLSDTAETPEEKKKRLYSIYIMYMAMFLSSVGFSILLASMEPFLTKTLKGTDEFLGWVVAAYSIGQFITSPLFGYWANHRPYKESLIVSIIINMLGNFMYCFSAAPDSGKEYVMLVSRFIVGLSAGNVAVTRAYVAGATLSTEKTKCMSVLSACQTGGFVIGPFIGSAFSQIEGDHFLGPFLISFCTTPALLSVFLGAVQIAIVMYYFKEYRLDGGVVAKSLGKDNDKDKDKEANINDSIKLPSLMPLDRFAIGSCIFMFFTILFVFTLYETIMTPFARDEYGWSANNANLYVGLLFGASGLISVVVFLFVKRMASRFGDRRVLIFGMIMVVLGFIVYLPWGPGNMDCQFHKYDNSTISPDDRFKEWCVDTPLLPLGQLFAAVFFIAVGYPIVTVLLFVIFSKVLGPGPQGTWMGILTAAGSAARTIGPIYITNVYKYFGVYVSFGSVLGLLILMTITAFVVYSRLVARRTFLRM